MATPKQRERFEAAVADLKETARAAGYSRETYQAMRNELWRQHCQSPRERSVSEAFDRASKEAAGDYGLYSDLARRYVAEVEGRWSVQHLQVGEDAGTTACGSYSRWDRNSTTDRERVTCHRCKTMMTKGTV